MVSSYVTLPLSGILSHEPHSLVYLGDPHQLSCLQGCPPLRRRQNRFIT